MKPLRAYFLLLLMIAGSGGFYYSCRITLWVHHNRMDSPRSAGNQSDSIILLKLSSLEFRNLHWKRMNIEFEYQGEYYDLVSSKAINGKTFLYCHHDKSEKKLISGMNRQLAGRSSQRRNPAFVSLGPFLEPFNILPRKQVGKHLEYYTVTGSTVVRFSELEAPPPKFLQL